MLDVLVDRLLYSYLVVKILLSVCLFLSAFWTIIPFLENLGAKDFLGKLGSQELAKSSRKSGKKENPMCMQC
jgi:hypothetical protein